jgi:ADP-heptose:LPS heptosyltransferase
VDYVISVDTSTGQLAGAVGIPSFGLLLPEKSDWRWGEGQSLKNIFFPNAELFWQEKQSDWSVPLAKLRKTIESEMYSLK